MCVCVERERERERKREKERRKAPAFPAPEASSNWRRAMSRAVWRSTMVKTLKMPVMNIDLPGTAKLSLRSATCDNTPDSTSP